MGGRVCGCGITRGVGSRVRPRFDPKKVTPLIDFSRLLSAARFSEIIAI
jgi:hypothetical protein